jgi:hypothetical protein
VIDRDTVVVNTAPRMSLLGFKAALDVSLSPARFEAAAAYAAIVAEGVDPAFLLAVFRKESQYATDPKSIVVKFGTKNPGNTRSSTIGPMPLISTERGVFVIYPDWTTGFKDMAHRLVTKEYVYAQEGRVTIGQIIERWAPKGDQDNDPAGYINTVISLMNSWIGEVKTMVAIPSDKDIGFPVRVHWAADQGPARNLSAVNWFVVHDTEGTMASDEPELTRDDAKIASCHALIAPDGLLVFMVPLSITAWTPGNDAVAERSINVEMSGFATKGYTEAQYKSMAAFFRWCLAQGCSIPAEYAARTGRIGIIGHQDVPNPNTPGAFGGASGHTDPGPLFSWAKFISYIKEGTNVPSNIPPGMVALDNPNNLDIYKGAWSDPATGLIVLQPFAAFYQANGGLEKFGKPTSGLYGTNGSQEQQFKYAHFYIEQGTGKVVAEMKSRVNPNGFNVGLGMLSKAREKGFEMLTNEQYYIPDPLNVQPGLGKMSRAWAQDKDGVTLVLMASELVELAKPGQDTPWKVEVLEVK